MSTATTLLDRVSRHVAPNRHPRQSAPSQASRPPPAHAVAAQTRGGDTPVQARVVSDNAFTAPTTPISIRPNTHPGRILLAALELGESFTRDDLAAKAGLRRLSVYARTSEHLEARLMSHAYEMAPNHRTRPAMTLRLTLLGREAAEWLRSGREWRRT